MGVELIQDALVSIPCLVYVPWGNSASANRTNDPASKRSELTGPGHGAKCDEVHSGTYMHNGAQN